MWLPLTMIDAQFVLWRSDDMGEVIDLEKYRQEQEWEDYQRKSKSFVRDVHRINNEQVAKRFRLRAQAKRAQKLVRLK